MGTLLEGKALVDRDADDRFSCFHHHSCIHICTMDDDGGGLILDDTSLDRVDDVAVRQASLILGMGSHCALLHFLGPPNHGDRFRALYHFPIPIRAQNCARAHQHRGRGRYFLRRPTNEKKIDIII